MKTFSATVERMHSGATLLHFLKTALKEYPSVKALKRAIDRKQCRVNGRVEFFSTYPVKKGQVVEICLEDLVLQEPLRILYEEEGFVLYNKPPGMLSELLGERFPGVPLIHRLDKDTSGVILVGKDKEMAMTLIKQFKERAVEKKYLVICDGLVSKKEWKVENSLEKKVSYQGGSLYGSTKSGRGKEAITHFECLSQGKEASLLLAKLETGRTHQIRVHLQEARHPVLGDFQYGRKFKSSFHPSRHLLHALEITFVHPITLKMVTFKAPVLKDFLDAQKILGLEHHQSHETFLDC